MAAWKAVMLQLVTAVSELAAGVVLPLLLLAVSDVLLGTNWTAASSLPPLQALSSPINAVVPIQRAKLQMRRVVWLCVRVMSVGFLA
jgi:hypothetical protein